MNNKEFDLTISNYGTTKKLNYDMVLLPWGATEPHNYHLPYMTDCILSHAVALDSAIKTKERYDLRVMVMPPVHYGSQNPGQRELPFCIHTRYETQKAILTDMVSSLYNQGFRKLLIINGHGGNMFKNMIRDLAVDYPDFFIATSEWFKMAKPSEYFDIVGDHADEIETSVMMHYYPGLVNLDEAGDASSRHFALEALRNGSVWLPRNWQKVSNDTGIGDPKLSTPNKGQRFANAVSDAYAKFIFDFVSAKTEEDLYK